MIGAESRYGKDSASRAFGEYQLDGSGSGAGNRAVMALELYLVAALSRRIRNTNLEIQGAWKQTHPEDFTEKFKPDEGPRTFAGRLKDIFSGRGGDR